MLARLAWEIGGAVAFGVLIGVLFALYLRYIGREITLVLLAVCARAEPGRHDAAAAAAAGRAGRRRGHREPGGRAGRRAARRGAARRAAGAGGVLRRGRRLTASRRARGHRLQRRRACRRSGSRFIRLGVARRGASRPAFPERSAPQRGPGWCRRPAITLGFASVVASGVSRVGQPGAAAARVVDRDPRAGRARFCSAAGWRRPASSMRRRPVRWSSCRTASRTSTARRAMADRGEGGDRWCRRGARRADARARRRVDRARRRHRRSDGGRCRATRCGCRPRARRTRSGGCGSRSRPSPPTTAALPTRGCGRSATWWTCGRSSAARTGRPTRTSTRASPPPFTTEIGSSDAPVFIQDYHLALVAPALRALRPDTRTALFWHIPWPYPGSPAHLPVAARARGRTAGQRSARLPGGARSPQFPDGGRGRARRRGRARVVARAVRRPLEHRGLGADRRRLRPHPELRRRPGAAAGAAAPARAARSARRDHRARRRSSGLHQGDSGAPRRPRRADGAAAGTAGQTDIRADWRAVAIGPRELLSDRGRDRPARSPSINARHAVPGGVARGLPITRRHSARSAWSRSTASRTSASSARCTTG